MRAQMSEAVNDSPIFVTEKAVDRDGLAVWSDGRSAEERKAYCKPPWPSLRPTAHGNDAIVIMNASEMTHSTICQPDGECGMGRSELGSVLRIWGLMNGGK